jgi:hypothetical protein
VAKKIIGRITMQFVQNEDEGRWHCEVKQPRMVSKVVRDTYKMALATAVLQDHINKTLDAIDRMIMNNAEIAEYRNMQVAEINNKPEGKVDIDLYQQPLPFGEKSNAI